MFVRSSGLLANRWIDKPQYVMLSDVFADDRLLAVKLRTKGAQPNIHRAEHLTYRLP